MSDPMSEFSYRGGASFQYYVNHEIELVTQEHAEDIMLLLENLLCFNFEMTGQWSSQWLDYLTTPVWSITGRQSSCRLAMPACAPKPIIDKLTAEIADVMVMPTFKQKTADLGATAGNLNPQQLATGYSKSELARWAPSCQLQSGRYGRSAGAHAAWRPVH